MYATLARLADRITTSRWNAYLNFAMNICILFSSGAFAVRRFQGGLVAATLAFASGHTSWGILEYGIHRWLFHGKRSLASHGHALHHKDPEALLSVPFVTGLSVAIVLWFALGSVLSVSTTLFYISGMTLGYTSYGVLHYLLHQRRFGGFYLSRLQRHHELHHRHARLNFGITTTYLDGLLGTAAASPRDPLEASR